MTWGKNSRICITNTIARLQPGHRPLVNPNSHVTLHVTSLSSKADRIRACQIAKAKNL
jgi:hypothetical protein